MNTPNAQFYIETPREDSINSLLNNCLGLNFDVLHAATGKRYVDNNFIRLVNLGSISLSSNYKLMTSSGKHIEDISHAHLASLMYKLTTSARDTDDLSIVLIVIVIESNAS